jgi:hypothetical protein
MGVKYLPEMSEYVYQKAGCHTSHHRNTETNGFWDWTRGKVGRAPSFKYILLVDLLDTVRSVALNTL